MHIAHIEKNPHGQLYYLPVHNFPWLLVTFPFHLACLCCVTQSIYDRSVPQWWQLPTNYDSGRCCHHWSHRKYTPELVTGLTTQQSLISPTRKIFFVARFEWRGVHEAVITPPPPPWGFGGECSCPTIQRIPQQSSTILNNPQQPRQSSIILNNPQQSSTILNNPQ